MDDEVLEKYVSGIDQIHADLGLEPRPDWMR